jgi:hypothetical protein
MFQSLFVIAVSLTLPAINLHAQQGLPSAATTIIGDVPMAATAATAVPGLVPYSGIALGRNGKPLTGQSSATFLIFKDQQGGEPLFIESQMIGFDEAGHYKVQLGASNASGLPSTLFSSGEARWLEVQIAGQPVEPRVLLASVPYAMKAADAATLGGLPASAFALASSVVGSTSVQADSITSNATSNVTTTGGTNLYLPKFNAASTIIDSEIYDTGTSVGIGDVPNAGARLDVNGAMIMRGNMQVTRTGNATTSKGYPSYGFDFFSNAYNSSSKASDNPYFQLQSEPTGNNTSSPSATFNLLFSNNGTAPTETGLYINPNGTVHFASGQTFPDTITGVTAGNGLTGGGTSGDPTVAINTATIPTLAGTNGFTGSNTFNETINEAVDIGVDSNNINPGTLSPGIRFGSVSGEGISSQRTANGADGSDGANQYGLDFYTYYIKRMSITSTGDVEMGDIADLSGPTSTTLYLNNDDGEDTNVLVANGTGGECNIDSNGDLGCTGTIYGATKDFKIDDPTDPANKYLVHASVESSEMMNIYSGNATTDGSGSATVTLPTWFEAENGDFRYQLTTIGQGFAGGFERAVQNIDQCDQRQGFVADHRSTPGCLCEGPPYRPGTREDG